ncbi:glycosyltransferase family A protein [Haloarcula marina]|uniref:glycosyltransferase family A protein n=1 Tax=Haloarcula marina TaxID=2961574 RepID=UPI0020B7D155|nr:glycosyltransferase family A protein [Halomicroarcula marina]
MAPTVSVVLPTHDRAEFVERAIDSVLGQTYEDFECLVVDDCSSDDTPSVVRSVEDSRVNLIRHETNRGASAARNTGIEAATGEFIAFLDDDDRWHPTKLEQQLDLLRTSAERVGLVYCWMEYRDSAETLVTEYCPTYSGWIFPDVLDKQRIGNSSTLLLPRGVVESVGGFDESLPRGNDGDFIRRVTREYQARYVSETLVTAYVDHERITGHDRQSARDAIRGQRVKFEKFGDELARYDEQRAVIYALIGFRYVQLGQYSRAAVNYTRAIATAPFCTDVYKQLLRPLRHILSQQ